MKKENIKAEIEKLKMIKFKWYQTNLGKSNTNDLLSLISSFNHTFSLNFPNAVTYYDKNSSAEINITDGIKELNSYVRSKLKKKDDHYFYDGIKNITNGIQILIDSLEYKIQDL